MHNQREQDQERRAKEAHESHFRRTQEARVKALMRGEAIPTPFTAEEIIQLGLGVRGKWNPPSSLTSIGICACVMSVLKKVRPWGKCTVYRAPSGWVRCRCGFESSPFKPLQSPQLGALLRGGSSPPRASTAKMLKIILISSIKLWFGVAKISTAFAVGKDKSTPTLALIPESAESLSVANANGFTPPNLPPGFK